MQSKVIFKCPQDLPNIEVNKPEFESGFEEKYVIGGFHSNWYQCSICHGYPRRPASLIKCGHFFCEGCIKGLFDTSSWLHPHALDGFERSCFCPMCKKEFSILDVYLFEAFQQWPKCLYLASTIQCPYECGYHGNAIQVDDHQVFHCKKRTVACPHLDCPVRLQADQIEQHFVECDFRRIFCKECKLPVFATQLNIHNCVDTLQSALIRMTYYYRSGQINYHCIAYTII